MGTEAAVAIVAVVSFEAGVEWVDVLAVLGVGVLCLVPGEVNPARALRWMDATVGCCRGLSPNDGDNQSHLPCVVGGGVDGELFLKMEAVGAFIGMPLW